MPRATSADTSKVGNCVACCNGAAKALWLEASLGTDRRYRAAITCSGPPQRIRSRASASRAALPLSAICVGSRNDDLPRLARCAKLAARGAVNAPSTSNAGARGSNCAYRERRTSPRDAVNRFEHRSRAGCAAGYTIAPSPPATAATRSTAPSTIDNSLRRARARRASRTPDSRRRTDEFVETAAPSTRTYSSAPGRRCSCEAPRCRGRRTRQCVARGRESAWAQKESRLWTSRRPSRLRCRARPTASAARKPRAVGRLVDRSQRLVLPTFLPVPTTKIVRAPAALHE